MAFDIVYTCGRGYQVSQVVTTTRSHCDQTFNKTLWNIHVVAFQTKVDGTKRHRWNKLRNKTCRETHQHAIRLVLNPSMICHPQRGVNLMAWSYSQIFPCEVSPHNS